MKSLKTLLAIALSTAGLGSAVALGIVSFDNENDVHVAEALTTCTVRGTLASYNISSDWSSGASFGTLSDNQFVAKHVHVTNNDEFKFVVDGTWLGYNELESSCKSLFNSGDNLYITTEGDYNFYVKASSIYVEACHTYGLIGSWNSWASDYVSFVEQADGTFTASLVVTDGQDVQFKIRADSAWTKDWGYSSLDGTNLSSYFYEGSSNNIGTEGIPGTYTFTLPEDIYSNSSATIAFSIVPDKADGAYLRGDWTNGWSESGQKTMTAITGGYEISGIDLGAGGTVKAVVMSGGLENWLACSTVSTTDSTNYPVAATDDNFGGYNATVTNAGTYTITITENNGNWNYGFEGTSNPTLEAAIAYAQSFNAAIDNVCELDGSTDFSSLNSVWSSQATAYNSLDSDVKAMLASDLSGSTASDLTAFDYKYNLVYGLYSSRLTAGNFANRSVSNSRNLTKITGTNYGVMTIAIISVVLLTSTGAFFLLRKKRKEQ